jgi:hypothetical protein
VSFRLRQSFHMADNRNPFLHRRAWLLDAPDIRIVPRFVLVVHTKGGSHIFAELNIGSAARVDLMDPSTVNPQDVVGFDLLDGGYTVSGALREDFTMEIEWGIDQEKSNHQKARGHPTETGLDQPQISVDMLPHTSSLHDDALAVAFAPNKKTGCLV